MPIQTESALKQPADRAGLIATAFARVRESLNPRTDAEAAAVADQLRLTRGSSNVTDAVVPIAAALVAYSCRHWAAPGVLIGWAGAIAAICLGINIAGRRLDPLLQRGVKSVRRVAQTRTAMTAALLAAWAASGVLLWQPGNPVNHMFVVLILACTVAGSAAMLAGHPASVAAAFVIDGGMLVARPALDGDPLGFSLAGLGFVFCVLMASQVRVIYAMTRHARELEFERQAIIRDLSKAKRESDRDRARAAQAGRTKTKFLSNMSHELRTPMNAILGFSELIKNKAFGEAVDKYAGYGEIIHDSGRHLLALINGMLDLARIEGGRLTLQESTFSIAALISEVVEGHRAAAEDAGLSPETIIAPDLPQIHADERAIRGILANLLSNAIKFTPPDGHITVSAAVQADLRMAIIVEDDGIGIAPEDQLQVFERFGLGRHDVTSAAQGTGLGLAIVKGFAEAHDGEVVLKSAPGVGTRVTVYLPAERIETALPKTREAG